MKRGMSGVLAVAFLTAAAAGGTVTFDPPTATVAPGETASFTVTVSSTDVATFSVFQILFSSDTPDLSLTFNYADALQSSFAVGDPTPAGDFPSDLLVGAFTVNAWQAPLLLGTLTVDTANLATGRYDDLIQVRPDAEQAAQNAPLSLVESPELVEETIAGAATLIISDPATDADRDGVVDTIDAFPNDPTETIDTDGDGIGDNADPDDDNDGILDAQDPTPTGDTTGNGGDGNGASTGGGVMCGMGMIPMMFAGVAGLRLLKRARRRVG